MNIKWIRIIVAGVIAEIVPIAVLVILVATLGPGTAEADEEFATRLGTYIGPIVGGLSAAVFAILITRSLKDGHVLNGFLLGLFIALLDAGLLIASGTEFQWLFVASGLGRIVLGTLGGYVASKMWSEK